MLRETLVQEEWPQLPAHYRLLWRRTECLYLTVHFILALTAVILVLNYVGGWVLSLCVGPHGPYTAWMPSNRVAYYLKTSTVCTS